jgi:hypothetical protein
MATALVRDEQFGLRLQSVVPSRQLVGRALVTARADTGIPILDPHTREIIGYEVFGPGSRRLSPRREIAAPWRDGSVWGPKEKRPLTGPVVHRSDAVLVVVVVVLRRVPDPVFLFSASLFSVVGSPIDPLADNSLSWLARPSPRGGCVLLLGQ